MIGSLPFVLSNNCITLFQEKNRKKLKMHTESNSRGEVLVSSEGVRGTCEGEGMEKTCFRR